MSEKFALNINAAEAKRMYADSAAKYYDTLKYFDFDDEDNESLEAALEYISDEIRKAAASSNPEVKVSIEADLFVINPDEDEDVDSAVLFTALREALTEAGYDYSTTEANYVLTITIPLT